MPDSMERLYLEFAYPISFAQAEIASTIFTYPVQRQTLPPNPALISSSEAFGFSSIKALPAMIIPAVQ